MMRKDVKIGFVVGGILVAVLIAVALVSGPKKPPATGADLTAGENSDPSTTTAGAPSAADTSAARSAEAPSPTTAPSDRSADPFKPGDATVAQANPSDAKKSSEPSAEDKWMMALNNGVMPMMTTNPALPVSARRNSSVPGPDNSPPAPHMESSTA